MWLSFRTTRRRPRQPKRSGGARCLRQAAPSSHDLRARAAPSSSRYMTSGFADIPDNYVVPDEEVGGVGQCGGSAEDAPVDADHDTHRARTSGKSKGIMSAKTRQLLGFDAT